MIESLSLRQMQRLHEIAKYDTPNNGRDYVFIHLTKDQENYIEALQKAIRFNGIILFVIREGSISFAVNMERIRLSANQMLISGPNSIITIDTDSVRNLDAYALFISDEFMHDLNFEIVILNNLPIASNRSPVLNLDAESVLHLASYMELLDMNVRNNSQDGDTPFAKSISRSLLTATLYQIMILAKHHKTAMREQTIDEDSYDTSKPRSRRILYTHEFVRLVRKYFRMEHSVRFYANKLCISPKYLSLVVKETSGRTAAEIIDEFLLLEAKNLLRFSGKNIQQVAYELNFSNQSSFGKYFKHLTGLSPSEFQNS
ncbi:MAG: helix-turn-helix domain-containing protein [Bacteroides sp.]|nr:helix-turn-helix domain-containing protein [Bacteroides sp.]MCM1378963.1 helix-turn-helix domain-containing protein [Bacteroides sp.]MCM1445579.1 helix-turn-helix domain-containing protein [Prevotella sp.]